MVKNSKLATYRRVSNHKTKGRTHEIDTITIHCMVGQATAKQCVDYFATTPRECSANYCIGYDGSIGISVDEKDRSWCSSNKYNDDRAVTIEVASDTVPPYAVTEIAYETLIKLVADVCQRNGIKKLLWEADESLEGEVDKQNMTAHRWFDHNDCPGEYLYSRFGEIASRVNAILDDKEAFTSFQIEVTNAYYPFRSEPTTDAEVAGVTGTGFFTIVELSGQWGRLKSGAGWVDLADTQSYRNMTEPTNESLELNIKRGNYSSIIIRFTD